MQRKLIRLSLMVVAATSMLIVDSQSSLGCRRCRRARARACYRSCDVVRCQTSPCAAPSVDPCVTAPSVCPTDQAPAEGAAVAPAFGTGYCVCVRERFAYIPPLHYHLGRRYPCCVTPECCQSFLPCQVALTYHVTPPQECSIQGSCQFSIRSLPAVAAQEDERAFSALEAKLPCPLPAKFDVSLCLMPGWTKVGERMGWVILPNKTRARVQIVDLKSPDGEAIGFGFEVEDDGTDAGFPETPAHSHLGNAYQHVLTVDGAKYFIVTSR